MVGEGVLSPPNLAVSLSVLFALARAFGVRVAHLLPRESADEVSSQAREAGRLWEKADDEIKAALVCLLWATRDHAS